MERRLVSDTPREERRRMVVGGVSDEPQGEGIFIFEIFESSGGSNGLDA